MALLAARNKVPMRSLIFSELNYLVLFMKIYELTISQLRRAAAIKEQIERLNKELRGILGMPAKSAAPAKKNRTVSAATKRKIAAAQKARWAKIRRAKSATQSAKG